ncbi:MAG: hypothetical protein JSR43_03415 [Proteobacteria bacterium]|nr:hypothetical protein [Pseudomonadota bacterium]
MGAAARWTWARFADLERNDLYDALALRSRVFVVAQRSAALRRAALAEAAERAARRQRVILLIVTMTRSPRRAARQSLDPVPAGGKAKAGRGRRAHASVYRPLHGGRMDRMRRPGKKKAPRSTRPKCLILWLFSWLPDLGSNQGPTD